MALAICRCYAVFLKLGVPSSSVLWAGVLILLDDIYFGFVSVILVISKFQFPPKIFLCFRVLDTDEDVSVMVFEARVELNSQSAITMTSF
jgi:hypothetical protein